MSKKLIVVGLLLLGLALVLAACTAPTTEATPCPDCPPSEPCPTAAACPDCPAPPVCPEVIVADVPFEEAWVNSGHADSSALAFRDWDEADPREVPSSCARCHSGQGYLDYVGADGTEAGTVEAGVPVDPENPMGTVITCATCHDATVSAMTSVVFPSGVEITGLGPEARCMQCHQGRASKVQVDAALEKFGVTAENLDVVPEPVTSGDTTSSLGFINVHYFAAAATLYGKETQGGYEYAGQMYDAKNDHVEGYNTCLGCHDQHSLELKIEQCAVCHEGVASAEDLKNVRMIASASDYDGDGDTTEGMYYEIAGLQEKLYAAIQVYAKEVAGTPIVYDQASHPYFFADADEDGVADQADGKTVRYTTWTGRLLMAAYNYQVSLKDPGAFAHGNKYIVQLLFDSITDLNTVISAPVDMSAAVRDDAGHFAGNTEPFRHWDAEEMTVPAGCVRCHSATGLPMFIANGSVIAQPASNGFACSTCHDEANWPARYVFDAVAFPSGASLSFGEGNDSNLCIACHQGRESTVSVNRAVAGKDADTPDSAIRFRNVHYFAAGATLFGSEAQGMYQYADKEYAGKTAHPVNECKGCHDVHALEVKLDTCAACHPGVTDPTTIRMTHTGDYDGDGDVAEGIYGEIQGLGDLLYAEMQTYAEAAGTPILYDSHAYPYFFVDADKDGVPDTNAEGGTIGYNVWTPRLLEAAYNYQYLQKDPGAFTHNPVYVMQILYDSIADLGGDVTALTRP